MRYLSLFSGIEAASVAWESLGWQPVAFSEIDPFCCEVLKYRFPDVPNLGDITQIDWGEFKRKYGTIDLIVGGSPCQSFSIAAGANRTSLDGKSNLMWEWVRAVKDVAPKWVVWENVPGALNTKDDAFGCLLRALQEIGYCDCAWRVLNAQYFGVPQRRKRVYLVGYLAGGGFRSASVLFDSTSLQGTAKEVGGARETYTNGVKGNSIPPICMADDTTNAAIDFDLCGTLKAGGGVPLIARVRSQRTTEKGYASMI